MSSQKSDPRPAFRVVPVPATTGTRVFSGGGVVANVISNSSILGVGVLYLGFNI